MSTYTVSPLDVVVSAARLAASSSDRSGAPLQHRVIARTVYALWDCILNNMEGNA